MRKTLFVLFMLLMLFAMPALAQTPGGDAAAAAKGWAVPIAAGIGFGIAVGLAALGQGRVAASACESMARNPAGRAGIQLFLIFGLAFIESLVLFAFVIVFIKVV
ncbi:ATP synthase F0 subcomplex C subunit [Candidatus Koribacter versatilis Ellin345]|uniref:ATP synthase subunit c n=1 Tax=Koribacter versatilis (strain Ellin345) TaxID=204669 RepID=Q1IS48_KORVE|nr:ATP synthase F0 subunit C [Candidatus Koribacter versatilis]ABF40302.1 ATP synthase F0 subcomplex C subunit [Candidatus Koribacter versatilis Ellin345]